MPPLSFVGIEPDGGISAHSREGRACKVKREGRACKVDHGRLEAAVRERSQGPKHISRCSLISASLISARIQGPPRALAHTYADKHTLRALAHTYARAHTHTRARARAHTHTHTPGPAYAAVIGARFPSYTFFGGAVLIAR